MTSIETINEWYGREMFLPNISSVCVCDNNVENLTCAKTDFTLLCYLDTLGCESCKLNLYDWNKYIKEIDSTSRHSVRFLFYFNTKHKNRISAILKREKFCHPICWDDNDSLNKLNNLPKEFEYQTFLLDKKNKVVAIGNPTINPKVKKIYDKFLGTAKVLKKKTLASLSMTNVDFGELQKNGIYSKKLFLFNKGGHNLDIYNVYKSCNCIKVQAIPTTIPPGKKAVITVTYRADKEVEFFETIHLETNSISEVPSIELHGIIN